MISDIHSLNSLHSKPTTPRLLSPPCGNVFTPPTGPSSQQCSAVNPFTAVQCCESIHNSAVL